MGRVPQCLQEGYVAPAAPPNMQALRAAATAKVAQFSTWLRGDIPLARQALRKLLAGPIRFAPLTPADGRKTLTFEGATLLGPLTSVTLASPRIRV